MSLGDAWTETTSGSASKLNKVTNISGSGTYLTGLTKANHCIFICTSTSGGLTKDHVYLCNADGDALIDLSDTNEHFHTSESDGGTLGEILASNPTVDTGVTLMSNLTAGTQWREAFSGTASSSTQTDGTTFERYVQIDTGATNGSTASEHIPIPLSLDFTKTSKFAAKHKINTATSLALKCGIGMESLSAADDNNRKYGGEICTTVNNNWFAASANGTTRSSSDTGEAMTTNKRAIVGIHDPGVNFKLYIENSVLYTKTSNLPTDNNADQPSRGAIGRYTIKNNTGSSRTFDFFGMRLIYSTNDGSLWF